LPPRAILTSARVGPYHVCTHIYIRPYTVPPTTLIPGSSDLGSPRVTGSQGNQVSKYPSIQEPQGHGVTGSRRRKVTGSQGYQSHIIIGSLDHLSRTHLSPWLGSPGSPWSQGYPDSRVTRSLGNQISRYQGNQVTRFSGSHITK